MNLSANQIVKLLHIKGLGRNKLLKLLEISQKQILNDNELIFFLQENLSLIQLKKIQKIDIENSFNKANEVLTMSESEGIKTISFLDELYPPLLKEIQDFPIILHYLGDIGIVKNRPTVAVIGTREPSEYGKQVGERIGYHLGEKNITVVSGLAKGCDSSAHAGCLKANGKTAAILAHGLDMVYPKENKRLADIIVEKGGCLISEYIIKTRAFPSFFVERDRIQAGISKATVVIETDINGGTMHTVGFAKANGRILSVFKHPKERRNNKSLGNEFLLESIDVKPLETKQDIDELIEIVNPAARKIITNNQIPIAEITLLFSEIEWEAMVMPKEKEKRKRKTRKKPIETQQLTLVNNTEPTNPAAKTDETNI